MRWWLGICLIMKNIASNSIHLILSDIPYGISFEEWDILHNNTNTALMGKSPAQKKVRYLKQEKTT